jgi:hypothetical protein
MLVLKNIQLHNVIAVHSLLGYRNRVFNWKRTTKDNLRFSYCLVYYNYGVFFIPTIRILQKKSIIKFQQILDVV